VTTCTRPTRSTLHLGLIIINRLPVWKTLPSLRAGSSQLSGYLILVCSTLCAPGVRDYLHKIRSEFEALLEENAAKPEAVRLPRSAFEVDPGLQEMIAEVSKYSWQLAA